MKKCLSLSLQDLKTTKIQSMCTSLRRHLNKWYERLSEFLLSQGYDNDTSDETLFIKKEKTLYLCKSMWMTSSLDPQMKKCVKLL